MFAHWLNAFPRQKATTLAVEKFLLKIIISTWPFPMNYMVIVELTLEDKYLKLFEDVFYCTEFLLFLQSSVLWIDGWMNKGYYKKINCTNCLKLSASLLGTFLLILLNLRSISFGNIDRLAKLPLLINAGRNETGNPVTQGSWPFECNIHDKALFIITSPLITVWIYSSAEKSSSQPSMFKAI